MRETPQHERSQHFQRMYESGKVWEALTELEEASEPELIGYRQIIETRIVSEFLAEPEIGSAILSVTGDFHSNFELYQLSVSEGYLISVVEGGLSLEEVLRISSLGRFATLLALAKLRAMHVVQLKPSAAR